MWYSIGLLCLYFVITFLLGSIPWGLIISKLAFKKDIRSEGSGNIGATNALRTMGKKGGLSVFLLDFGKGVLAGVIGWLFMMFLLGLDPQTHRLAILELLEGLGVSHAAALSTGVGSAKSIVLSIGFLGCTWGHIFSPWLKFHGGKGISVAIGFLFILYGPWFSLAEIALFVVIVAATKYVSAGSIAAAALCPFIALYVYWGYWFAIGVITLAALTVIWAHRANIKRLANGTESKLSFSKKMTTEGER